MDQFPTLVSSAYLLPLDSSPLSSNSIIKCLVDTTREMSVLKTVMFTWMLKKHHLFTIIEQNTERSNISESYFYPPTRFCLLREIIIEQLFLDSGVQTSENNFKKI